MKEYIKNTIYDNSGLLIGMSEGGTSMIFGQNNEWVVLGSNDIKKIINNLKKNKLRGSYDDFRYTLKDNGLMLHQDDNCVYVTNAVFNTILGGRN